MLAFRKTTPNLFSVERLWEIKPYSGIFNVQPDLFSVEGVLEFKHFPVNFDAKPLFRRKAWGFFPRNLMQNRFFCGKGLGIT